MSKEFLSAQPAKTQKGFGVFAPSEAWMTPTWCCTALRLGLLWKNALQSQDIEVMDLCRELRSMLLRRPGGRYSCAQASRFVENALVIDDNQCTFVHLCPISHAILYGPRLDAVAIRPSVSCNTASVTWCRRWSRVGYSFSKEGL